MEITLGRQLACTTASSAELRPESPSVLSLRRDSFKHTPPDSQGAEHMDQANSIRSVGSTATSLRSYEVRKPNSAVRETFG